MKRLALTLLTAVLALAVGGCGYNQSNDYSDKKSQGRYQWRSLYRQDIRTVAVPIFTNKSFFRGTEFKLTKAVINDLEVMTPYKVVDRAQADTILEGEIVNVVGGMISADRHTALPQEEMVTITINFIWKDLRTGKILTQRKGFAQSAMYYPTLGESVAIGEQSGVEKLAAAVVQQLEAEW